MAKYKIEWSTDAKSDLFDILDFYIQRNKSATYSKKLNTEIDKSIKLISRNPLIGTKTDYDTVRALITGDYQIIYEIFDQLLLIIMIWDCRRDPDDKRIGKRIK
ncbi:type II toxin-antitoxin system RelE/ParE family toxin [Sunxiuqinia dokdonensis]|uniref:type II toxin-antitoxin system RelE/ParE family toxin n=1 Tax=Sunxiuqinia dokdonensis TaxID=1409788 RepID=UPI00069E7162|nr:type II toxin-antitoxin system RelE/ParE family toxin [Sunxiuqinia dokdonensis]